MVSRTRDGTRCHRCTGKILSDENRLSVLYPVLCGEWDHVRNKKSPDEYSYGSGKKVWWKCHKCGRGWRATISNRTRREGSNGCPSCSVGSGVSLMSQRWLDSLGIENIKRESYIKPPGLRVDGYDLETNTVYEFLGDFWHGKCEIYDPEKINPRTKKSFGQLYKEMYQRFRLLEEAGYKVVYIWESDFKEGRDSRVFNKNNRL